MGIIVGLILIGLVGLGVRFWLKNSSSKASQDGIEAKEYYIKKHPSASSGQESSKGVWLTLADDTSQTLGHYKGEKIKEGFAHIKGVKKKEKDKTYIEISEIIPVE